MAGRRFSEVEARRWSSTRAACVLAVSRLARSAFRRAIWERSISASMRRIGILRGSSATKSLTPTTICSFFSTARLNGDADDVVFRLLRGEGGAGSLRVEAQHQRAWVFRAEAFRHDFGPEAAGGSILGDFFEKIVMSVEEKRKLRSKFIDAESGVERGLNVGDAIGKREGDFLDCGRTGFADVITGDRDGVPLRDVVAAPRENVGDNAHRGAHGIDVGAAGDVFLQNVVLHGAGKLLQGGALPFGDRNVEAEQDGSCGVDGHGGGDFFERDTVEERLHIFEGVDGDANFTDFAEGERMIRIHADLRGEIEGDGEPGLSLAQKIAIALVGFDGGAEAGVLAHGPEAAAVHGGIDAAGERKFAGITEGGFGIPVGEMFFVVQAIHGKARESGESLLAFGERGGLGFGVRHGSRKVRKELFAKQAQVLRSHRHNLRALRKEVTAKNRNNRAVATAMLMSQRATSRVQARSAALSQPSARTAKTAAMAS